MNYSIIVVVESELGFDLGEFLVDRGAFLQKLGDGVVLLLKFGVAGGLRIPAAEFELAFLTADLRVQLGLRGEQTGKRVLKRGGAFLKRGGFLFAGLLLGGGLLQEGVRVGEGFRELTDFRVGRLVDLDLFELGLSGHELLARLGKSLGGSGLFGGQLFDRGGKRRVELLLFICL